MNIVFAVLFGIVWGAAAAFVNSRIAMKAFEKKDAKAAKNARRLQMLVDIVGGCDVGFSLADLTIISVLLLIGIIVTGIIGYRFRPKFIVRGISQYKEYVFSLLTKKSISAFSGERPPFLYGLG